MCAVSHVCRSFNDVSDRLCAAGLDAGVTWFRLNTDGEGMVRPIQSVGAHVGAPNSLATLTLFSVQKQYIAIAMVTIMLFSARKHSFKSAKDKMHFFQMQ